MNGWQTAVLLAYDAVLLAAWPFFYLYYLCRANTDGKYAESYRARMGFDLPKPMEMPGKTVWFHALSVGEVLSALPLMNEMKKLQPDIAIAFSTSTETGMAIARQRISSEVDRLFFMPLDFPWAVRSLIKRIQPHLFVLIETDLWPNLLQNMARKRVVTALVNGRISPSSYRGYLRFAGILRTVFSRFDLLFAQTEQDRKRFESLGVNSAKVSAVGNLKFDSSVPLLTRSEAALLRQQAGIELDRPVWIAGSTHEGEEDLLVRVHEELREEVPNLLLIIAPRNIRRRGELEGICTASRLGCAVRSRGEQAGGKAVYLLDTLGELAAFYALCDVAFIGGSLVPFGGHNPLEAVSQGKPACWGPHFFNFQEIEQFLITKGQGGRIESESELTRFIGKNIKIKESGSQGGGDDRSAPFQPGVSHRIAFALLEKTFSPSRVQSLFGIPDKDNYRN